MKKTIILFTLILVLLLGGCTNSSKDEVIASIKPYELKDESKLIMDIITKQNAKIFKLKLNQNENILETVTLYLYQDCKWESRTLCTRDIYDLENNLIFSMIDINDGYILNYDNFNNDFESFSHLKFDIEYNLNDDINAKSYGFLDNEVEMKLDDEIIIYKLLASNNNTLSTSSKLNIDNFMKEKDLDYENGMLITIKYTKYNN